MNRRKIESEFLKIFNKAITFTKATRNVINNQSDFKTLFYDIIDNILMQLFKYQIS